MKRNQNLCWYEVFWQRPFELDAVYDLLTNLAATAPRGAVVWEIRGSKGNVRFFLGTFACYSHKIHDIFRVNGKVRFTALNETDRAPMTAAKRLKISKPALSLKTDTTLSVIRSGLAAMTGLPQNVEAVLQIVLGASYAPRRSPSKIADPHATWFDFVTDNVPEASSESMASIRGKAAQHGFCAVMRLGISDSAKGYVFHNILSALRIVESVGVRITTVNEKTEHLNNAYTPWHFPLRLSVKELANFLLLPAGKTDFIGIAGIHPKALPAPQWYREPADGRCFARSLTNTNLSIAPTDALEHTIVLGPTGVGKSNVMLHLILADIKAGRGVLVIDPKTDLVNDVLARIPADRDKDVVVIDPSDPCPVGFNPFAFKDYGNPNLIADAVLAVFKEVFSENWGIRSADVMTAALLTLAQSEGASLLWLPALLTNDDFRQKVTSNIQDKIGLEPYWTGFEAMKDSERRMEIAPVLNKIRQFMLRPGLRNVLGQSQPKFMLTDLFAKNKIVLVPLNKGIIGAESARLLGSLIIGMTWTLALSRANLPKEQRPMIGVFIDELQDYLSLPTSLSDALAQARGLGVALTMAHQYRAQLPPDIRSGVDANARNKIIFGLNGGEDANAMAAMAKDLENVDFMLLPRYQIYSSFQSGGKATGWVSGQTLPPPPKSRDIVDLRAQSMAAYGQTAEQVEAEYLEILNASRSCYAAETAELEKIPIGRRKL
ncbi:MAG: type IV secretion system DNA-binding domain-containing protein [Oscillospiraceae bacterium]|jgi:hypothetical protein|nr:type IV secretion system DNA-binding domain-containing protein [Oscillospiraceae bacterium]